ncbi:MAG: hypothetical protein IJ833_07025 [Lachnospiraceae bacterium]|nr:hypothetical protein [Lachnospiraceae bacterium]
MKNLLLGKKLRGKRLTAVLLAFVIILSNILSDELTVRAATVSGNDVAIFDEENMPDSLTVTEDLTLEQDMVIYDLTVDSGTLNLDGHSLTVQGNLIQPGGSILLNGGSLLVGGDYRIQSESRVGEERAFVKGYGSLQMDKPQDYVLVEGDFWADTCESLLWSYGTFEIKGDFQIAEGTYFKANYGHTLVVSGSNGQRIALNCADNVGLYHLQIENESEEGLFFAAPVYVAGTITDNGCPKEGVITFDRDTKLADGKYTGDIVCLWELTLTEEWSIQGNLTLKYGASIAGELKVYGDLMTEERLRLSGENASVYVEGCFYSTSWNSWSMGSVEVEGDFVCEDSLWTSGTNVIILSGQSEQRVSLVRESSVYQLKLYNDSDEGIWSKTPFKVKILEKNGTRLRYGMDEGVDGWTLEGDEHLAGDLIQVAGELQSDRF